MLKIIITLLVITMCSIILFALLYDKYTTKGFFDALYTSTMIQTLVGIQNEPTLDIVKFFMIIQSIISYFITAHIIIFGHQYIKKI
jgi:hypothetical protein